MSLLADLGVLLRLRVWTDSTASRGMCERQGLGKVRRLDVQELWVQQRVVTAARGTQKEPSA